MSCCWHVCGHGALSETKLHLLIWPKCSLNLGDPETFLFSMEHSLGNATKNRFPEGLASLIAKHGLKQTVSFPWQLTITWQPHPIVRLTGDTRERACFHSSVMENSASRFLNRVFHFLQHKRSGQTKSQECRHESDVVGFDVITPFPEFTKRNSLVGFGFRKSWLCHSHLCNCGQVIQGFTLSFSRC